MIRLAANLSFLFAEMPFLDRFAAAARAGFGAVEYAFAYDVDPQAIAARLADHGLTLVLINSPPGDLAAGEIGLATLPGREAAFRASMELAVAHAATTGARQIHMLTGNCPPGTSRRDAKQRLLANLAVAAELAGAAGIGLTIEPLNAFTYPDYFLRSNAQAAEILDLLARPGVGLQVDIFHCMYTESDPVSQFDRFADRIAHVQVAGVPGRHEPDAGIAPYEGCFERLEAAGYAGFIGCEYHPAAGTLAGLGWARPYLDHALQ